MAMKPLPRLILIVAAVGGIAYGLKYMGDKEIAARPVAAPASVALQPASDALPVDQYVKPEQAPATPQPAPQAAPQPAAEATATDAGNAGLSKLLSAGAKK